ncbi:MAG: SPOR domain-containing protein [Spirochaetales bacterium]|nr:SPOR domain-containing protein [Spirochaetales bacterium]
MKRIIICLILVFSCAVMVTAEESWQGNAAVAHQGEFGSDGLYAASNSFPENTLVTVMNLENGKSVNVTIKKRIDGSAGLFLLLSANAATVLGMKTTDIIPVETQIIGISNDLTGMPNEFVYNPDSDVNPSAGTPNLRDIQKDTTDTTQPDVTVTQPDVTVTQPDVTIVKSRDPLADRNPQKDLFVKPHEDATLSVNDRKQPKYDTRDSAITKLDEAKVQEKERGNPNAIVRPNMPDEDVVAILVEPKSLDREKADITSVRRPGNDYTGPEVALLDAELQEKDIPTVEEIQRMDRERESLVLKDHDSPTVRTGDRATVDERTLVGRDDEEFALKDYNYPEVRTGDRATVDERTMPGYNTEELAMKDPNLPEVKGRENASVDERRSPGYDHEDFVMKDHNYPEMKSKDEVLPDTTIPDMVDRTTVITKTELALVPTGPRPPSTDRDVYTPRTTTPVMVPENLDSLAKKNYYLQLGVYKTIAEAEQVAGMHKNYPMEIITASAGGYSVYKVVVGPLKRDEGGTVLYLFKANGYKDAFIRYVE